MGALKAKITKIEQLKGSRNWDGSLYYRLKFQVKTEDGRSVFAMSDIVPGYRNFPWWEPVIKAGPGTVIGGVYLKENYKPYKVDADSQVFIIHEPLFVYPQAEPLPMDQIRLVKSGHPETWYVPSKTGMGRGYHVGVFNGAGECECMGFKYSGSKRTCEHIKKVLDLKKKTAVAQAEKAAQKLF